MLKAASGAALCLILLMVLIFGLGWIIAGNDLAQFSFFAPRFEAAHREVYQQTPSFLNGNRQNLLNEAATYRTLQDPAAKASLRSAMRAQVNSLPPDFEVPFEVRSVLAEQ